MTKLSDNSLTRDNLSNFYYLEDFSPWFSLDGWQPCFLHNHSGLKRGVEERRWIYTCKVFFLKPYWMSLQILQIGYHYYVTPLNDIIKHCNFPFCIQKQMSNRYKEFPCLSCNIRQSSWASSNKNFDNSQIRERLVACLHHRKQETD